MRKNEDREKQCIHCEAEFVDKSTYADREYCYALPCIKIAEAIKESEDLELNFDEDE